MYPDAEDDDSWLWMLEVYLIPTVAVGKNLVEHRWVVVVVPQEMIEAYRPRKNVFPS